METDDDSPAPSTTGDNIASPVAGEPTVAASLTSAERRAIIDESIEALTGHSQPHSLLLNTVDIRRPADHPGTLSPADCRARAALAQLTTPGSGITEVLRQEMVYRMVQRLSTKWPIAGGSADDVIALSMAVEAELERRAGRSEADYIAVVCDFLGAMDNARREVTESELENIRLRGGFEGFRRDHTDLTKWMGWARRVAEHCELPVTFDVADGEATTITSTQSLLDELNARVRLFRSSARSVRAPPENAAAVAEQLAAVERDLPDLRSLLKDRCADEAADRLGSITGKHVWGRDECSDGSLLSLWPERRGHGESTLEQYEAFVLGLDDPTVPGDSPSSSSTTATGT